MEQVKRDHIIQAAINNWGVFGIRRGKYVSYKGKWVSGLREGIIMKMFLLKHFVCLFQLAKIPRVVHREIGDRNETQALMNRNKLLDFFNINVIYWNTSKCCKKKKTNWSKLEQIHRLANLTYTSVIIFLSSMSFPLMYLTHNKRSVSAEPTMSLLLPY